MRTTGLLAACLLLFGCTDYELHGNDDVNDGPDTDDEDVDPDDTDSTPDDTDEPDPTDCDVTLEPAGTTPIEPACEGYDSGTVSNPWDLKVEWQYTSGGASVVMPAVGNLTDDNGDGKVDEHDTPDVAFSSYGYSSATGAHVLDGATGTLQWSSPGFRSDGGVIIADVDGDSFPELVGPTTDGRVRAVNGKGVVKWTSPSTFPLMYPVTTAADLDGNGTVEVIADVAVVNGADGTTVATLPMGSFSSTWRTPVVADVDLDGRQEIVLGPRVFRSDGTPWWDAVGSGTSCFNAIAQLDSDSEAEVIFAYGGQLLVYEHDGTLKYKVPLPGSSYAHPGPPCVGDLDGDGLAEIVAPSGNNINAFEHDGTTKWSATMSDSSGAAGCSVYDMNGDNTYEVIFADETDLRIYDGTTGAVLYSNPTHGSVTYFEYPVIADVDLDGSAEILVAASSGVNGITVFGHNGSGWPKSGPTWGIHDFAATNQDFDGGIPTSPTPSWQAYNVFRGRPSTDIPASPDLLVSVTDTCVTTCDDGGLVKIAWQLKNQGGEDVLASTVVALYLVDGGVETLYDSVTLGTVAKGTSLAGGEFDVLVDDFGDGGFVIRADDGTGSGAVYECDEGNNDAVYVESFCG